jgi:MoxR-like ATPase
MAEYALSTDLYSFAQITQDYHGWPRSSREGEVVSSMNPGDYIVPKFAQGPTPGPAEGREERQRAYCQAIGLDFDEVRQLYEDTIQWGEAAVPFVLRVTDRLPDQAVKDRAWARVAVEKLVLDYPLATAEFLRLRVIPPELSAQFKGMAAPGRHLQELPAGTAARVLQAGLSGDRGDDLRLYSLVRSAVPADAVDKLTAAGRRAVNGDRAYLVSSDRLFGVHEANAEGGLVALEEPVDESPLALKFLFELAKARQEARDRFPARPGIHAGEQIGELMTQPEPVIAVDNFSQFHDRYVRLAPRLTKALSIIAREGMPDMSGGVELALDTTSDGDEEESVSVDEMVALDGLTVGELRKHLEGVEMPDSVLAEAITALRSGKHLLLSGPPGTGKSTLAEAISRAVVGKNYDVATATADWTTFDTIGGYMPVADGLLEFHPGTVLRCLQDGRWLIIDELNRADIDKAFGPLFTLLAGTATDQPNRGIVLPFQEDGKAIAVRWAEERSDLDDAFVLTPSWRLIGTLNVSDKASLFQLSFAFLRRFAVVDVPLPPQLAYRAWFSSRCEKVPEGQRAHVVDAAMALAHASAERQLGPAILADIANFVDTGLTRTASGANYDDPVAAFLTACRLYAVPQYEGASAEETAAARSAITSVWDEPPADAWAALENALRLVEVS